MRETWSRSPLVLVVLVALACTVMAISGCSADSSKGGPINKINWVLTAYSDGGTLKDAPEGTEGSAWFADDDVTGVVVNTYQGTFVTGPTGAVTAAGPFTTSKMAGPPDLMAVEAAYLADLEKTTSFYSDGKTLTLYGEGDEVLLVYRVTATP